MAARSLEGGLVSVTLGGMSDDYTPADSLYYAIADLKGWDEFITDAQDIGGNYKWAAGRFLSSLVLAVGEEAAAIAVGGELDLDGQRSGYLVVVFGTGIAYVDMRKVDGANADYTITLHTFAEVKALTVRSSHNFFDGTKSRPRHHGIQVGFTLFGESVSLGGRPGSRELTDSASIARAFAIIRDARG